MRFRIIFSTVLTILLFLAILLGIRFGYLDKVVTFLKISHQENKKVIPAKPVKNHLSLDSALAQCFRDLEISQNQVTKKLIPEDSTLQIKFQVPRGKPMEWIVWFVSSCMLKADYINIDCIYHSEQKGCRLEFKSLIPDQPGIAMHIIHSSAFFSKTARMAILVEDFGFSADETTIGFLSFPEPLTVSMASTKKLSTWTAQIANEYHKEIIVMLPMEPLPASSRYSKSAIMVHYPEEKIRSILNAAAEAVPHLAGFSNYYGQKVLEDTRVMEIIFSEINKRNSYFIMTPETRKSVSKPLAGKMNIPFGIIDFTINTDLSAATIQDSLHHYAIVAQNKGNVILKGKASPSFIKALKNALPGLKQYGIGLVYVSEIVKTSAKENKK